jgi:hypothetical protein
MSLFVFGIPLRSRVTARSWDTAVRLLERTLGSVLAQTDDRFRIILACHERPEIRALNDPRVLAVQATFPPPASFDQQMQDKGMKRRLIGATLRKLGGGYMMMVDADDLVSNRLVAYVHQDCDPNGYVLKKGYEFDAARHRLRGAPRFNRLCGTSAIIRFSADELPTSVDDYERRYFSLFSNHVHWEEVARSNGRPLKPLPFRGAVYVMNNGENHSVQAHNIGWRRQVLRRFTPHARLSENLRREFGITDKPGVTLPQREAPSGVR